MSDTHLWRSAIVIVEPFPRAPFSEQDFDTFCDMAYKRLGDYDPGLSMSNGVIQVSFDGEHDTEKMAAAIAHLLHLLDVETASVRGHYEWTVMK